MDKPSELEEWVLYALASLIGAPNSAEQAATVADRMIHERKLRYPKP